MRPSSLVAVVLMAVILAPQVQETKAQSWVDLLPAVIEKLLPLWGGGPQEFLGTTCTFSRRPTFRNLELYHKTSLYCPSISLDIKGQGLTRSFSRAVGEAMKDYLQKAIAQGAVTEQETEQWLKKQ